DFGVQRGDVVDARGDRQFALEEDARKATGVDGAAVQAGLVDPANSILLVDGLWTRHGPGVASLEGGKIRDPDVRADVVRIDRQLDIIRADGGAAAAGGGGVDDCAVLTGAAGQRPRHPRVRDATVAVYLESVGRVTGIGLPIDMNVHLGQRPGGSDAAQRS